MRGFSVTTLKLECPIGPHIGCCLLGGTYDSDTNTAVVSTPDAGEQAVVVEVIFNEQGTILITSLDQKHSLLVDTTKPGSDGMSDFVYPFEGVLNENLIGGCSTDHLKKKLNSTHGYHIR